MNIKEKNRIISALRMEESIQNADDYFTNILQIKSNFLKDEKKIQLSKIMNAFGNIERLVILDALKHQDRCICEIEAIIEKTSSGTSHHLKVLEEMHLIRGWKKGKFTYYSLVEKTFNEFDSLWKEWRNGISNWFGV